MSMKFTPYRYESFEEYSMARVAQFRALRYKLFFVKALTKRLRKLTIITKRL